MQIALVLFAIRTDATVPALQDYIQAKLGRFFLEPPPLELSVAYQDSDPATPLIYVLASGSDPMADITKLAEGMDMLSKINPISLGQGQGPKAIAGIKDGGEQGKWVLLQNCHLGVSFMPTLENIIEKFVIPDLDPAFRLWLTACPSPDFPISILQNGVKMAIEEPRGLRMALTRAYMGMDEEWFEGSKKSFEFKKMLFGLCFFHGLVLERRGFGPQGWNIPYGFSEHDLAISRLQLKQFLEDFAGVPWDALNYMVAEANYGGRCTDTQDRRALAYILTVYYTPEVLKEEYKFSVSGLYYSPPEGPLSSYLEFIKALPMSTTPEVFCMHTNASLTASINEGMSVLKSALTMMGSFGASTGGGDDDDEGGKAKTPEEIFSQIAADCSAKLPPKADMEAVQRTYPVKYDQCLNTVLHTELGKFNRLLGKLSSTLNDLGKAVKGLVVFSPELEEVGAGCLTNKIPAPWIDVSYPSLKPMLSYIDDFMLRWKFVLNWIKGGIPLTFWFSAYFFQQAFLTGVLQNFARKDQIAIDRCIWNYTVMKYSFKAEAQPEKGAYSYGLYMEGARWDDDNMCIADSFPKVLWCEFSTVWLKPVQIEEDEIRPDKMYACPVYKTSARRGVLSTSGHSSNFILWMSIPHSCQGVHSEVFWTQRGVAFISQTDD